MADSSNSCIFNSEVLSKDILEYLIQGQNFGIDDVEWDESKFTFPEDFMTGWGNHSTNVSIEELTSGQPHGSGDFDIIMESLMKHLRIEYDAGRITGADYANAYTHLVEVGISTAVQFTLQKNQSYFQSLLAQAQAISAGLQAQIAIASTKLQFAKIKADALTSAANYSLTTMKLATEDAQHGMLCAQQKSAEEQLKQAEFNTRFLDPDATDGKNYDVQLKEKQVAATQKQIDHVTSQISVEEKQKALYTQQIESYKRKSEKDVAELFSNAYITMKSVDEGLSIPKAFSGASINDVLQNLKKNVDLGENTTNVDSYTIGETTFNGISDMPEEGTEANLAYLQYGVLSTNEEDED